MANFRIPVLELLKNELAAYAKQVEPFTITSYGKALFGPNKNVAVSLIRPEKSILGMHNELLSIALKLSAIFDEPSFIAEGFRPHATIQLKSRLEDKQTIRVTDFTLVDMYPNNDINRRRIVETYTLSA